VSGPGEKSSPTISFFFFNLFLFSSKKQNTSIRIKLWHILTPSPLKAFLGFTALKNSEEVSPYQLAAKLLGLKCIKKK
jgi:hypothetical protein